MPLMPTQVSFETWSTLDFHTRFVRPVKSGDAIRIESKVANRQAPRGDRNYFCFFRRQAPRRSHGRVDKASPATRNLADCPFAALQRFRPASEALAPYR